MPTLHIEHAIVDLEIWRTAFDRFSDVRKQAGVRRHRIRRPLNDANYVLIDLEFDTADQAENFCSFLEKKVWCSSDASPALVGTPQTRILEDVAVT